MSPKTSCVQEKREIVPRISSESHQCCSTCQLACCHQSMLLGRAVRQKKLKGYKGGRENCTVIHLESQLTPGHKPRESIAGHFCYSLAAPSLFWPWPSPRQLDSAGHVGSGTEVRDSWINPVFLHKEILMNGGEGTSRVQDVPRQYANGHES